MKRRLPVSFPNDFRTDSGSVIIWILIAVALFASLSFAVSQMMRSDGGADAIADEKAALIASEILDYARTMRESVQVMKIDGCEDTDISFENDAVSGYEHDPLGPEACRLFRVPGAGMNYLAPDGAWLDTAQSSAEYFGDWFMTGESCVYDIGSGGIDCATANGTDDNDLIAVLPWIRERLCVAINDRLGITNPGGRPPVSQEKSWEDPITQYEGTFTSGTTAIQSDISGAAILRGKIAGCFEGDKWPSEDTYHFYQVLIAR